MPEKKQQKVKSTSPVKSPTKLSNDSINYIKALATQSIVSRNDLNNANQIANQDNKVNVKDNEQMLTPKTANLKEINNLKTRLNEIMKTEIEDIPIAEISHSRILLEIVEYINAWDIDLF